MDYTPLFSEALQASRQLILCSNKQIEAVLNAVADAVEKHTEAILSANRIDLERMSPQNPKYDRLKLTEARIKDMANGVREVAQLPSPIDIELEQITRPNGLKIRKVTVPFGVVGVIYEARPNVSLDVFSICFRSGNVCLLKGGSDAAHSNNAIVSIIQGVLKEFNLPTAFVTLLPPEREAATALLNAVGYVDLLIPRGSASLIAYVRDNARIPVIETGAGICHTYIDKDADCLKAQRIVLNAKTRRVSVCNALDCLIVHQEQLPALAQICRPLADKQVTILADAKAYTMLLGHYPQELLQKATSESYGTEFLDYKMAIKTVDTFEEAVAHIAQYSSKHSEAIVSENTATSQLFERVVDAACVYVNAPTSFTDGGQFGLGAEIGISTQKLHARGPMALRELTSYKWLISGNGQIRE